MADHGLSYSSVFLMYNVCIDQNKIVWYVVEQYVYERIERDVDTWVGNGPPVVMYTHK